VTGEGRSAKSVVTAGRARCVGNEKFRSFAYTAYARAAYLVFRSKRCVARGMPRRVSWQVRREQAYRCRRHRDRGVRAV